jgi:hypothetical protein
MRPRRSWILFFLSVIAALMVALAWYTSGSGDPAATPSATSNGGGRAKTALTHATVVDVHRVDWPNVTIPGRLCAVAGSIKLRDGSATASSKRWGQVHVSMQGTDAVYGDLDGDRKDEAAVVIWCDNGGGTAAGQLAQGLVVFRNRNGQLHTIATVTPRQQPVDVHTSFVASLRFARGQVVAHERWYRNTDPTCCPSGTATTVWKYTGGHLVPGPPKLT